MNKYLKTDSWRVIEEGFNPQNHRSSESIFSLGNGRMGQRANFEEKYTGKMLQGTYIGGVYYTDKTRVGWWKNGYPEYFAKVLNAPNWTGINVEVNGQELDLAVCGVRDFVRTLNMREGYLERSFIAVMPAGEEVKVVVRRFISMAEKEAAAIRYSVTAVNFAGEVKFTSYVDGDVSNQDANYDEQFWNILKTGTAKQEAYLLAETKKTGFQVAMGVKYVLTLDDKVVEYNEKAVAEEKYEGNKVVFPVKKN